MEVAFAPIPRELVYKTTSYDYKEPLSSALSDIYKLGAVIVTKNRRYYGIADDRVISRHGIVKVNKSFQIGKIAKITPTVDKDSTIEHAIISFYHSSAKALPYVDGDQVKGVIRRTEILKSMLSLNLMSRMKAEDAMTAPVLAVDYNATVEQAAKVMRDHKVYRLVVLQNNDLYGLLTYKNMMHYSMATKERAPKLTVVRETTSDRVGDICGRSFYSIESGKGINDVLRSFVKNNISSLIVVKKGRAVGIVTVRDVFELFVKNASQRMSNIIISGLDDETRQYESDIRNSLDALVSKINKFKKIDVEFVSLNVKRVKARSYELHARLSLAKRGIVSMHLTGFTLDNALKALTDKLYIAVEKKKEIILANRKV